MRRNARRARGVLTGHVLPLHDFAQPLRLRLHRSLAELNERNADRAAEAVRRAVSLSTAVCYFYLTSVSSYVSGAGCPQRSPLPRHPHPRSRSGWRACVRRRALCRPDAVAARSPPRPVRPRDIPRRPVERRPVERRAVAEQIVRRMAGRRAAGRRAAGRFRRPGRSEPRGRRARAAIRTMPAGQHQAACRGASPPADRGRAGGHLPRPRHHPAPSVVAEMRQAIAAYGGNVEALEQDAESVGAPSAGWRFRSPCRPSRSKIVASAMVPPGHGCRSHRASLTPLAGQVMAGMISPWANPRGQVPHGRS